jgi:hypothetical protein
MYNHSQHTSLNTDPRSLYNQATYTNKSAKPEQSKTSHKRAKY